MILVMRTPRSKLVLKSRGNNETVNIEQGGWLITIIRTIFEIQKINRQEIRANE